MIMMKKMITSNIVNESIKEGNLNTKNTLAMKGN
jgi:hypothetical protein